MTIWRRVRFYLVGLLLGIVMVQIMFKGRGCKGLKGEVVAVLERQPFKLSEEMNCLMVCYGLEEADLKAVAKSGTFNFDRAREKPCPVYEIEGNTTKNEVFEIIYAKCEEDSITIIKGIRAKEYEPECNC